MCTSHSNLIHVCLFVFLNICLLFESEWWLGKKKWATNPVQSINHELLQCKHISLATYKRISLALEVGPNRLYYFRHSSGSRVTFTLQVGLKLTTYLHNQNKIMISFPWFIDFIFVVQTGTICQCFYSSCFIHVSKSS